MTPEALSNEFNETLHEAISPETMREKLKSGIPLIVAENGKNYAIMPSKKVPPPETPPFLISKCWILGHLTFLEENLPQIRGPLASYSEEDVLLIFFHAKILRLAHSISKLDGTNDEDATASILRCAYETYIEMNYLKYSDIPDKIKKFCDFWDADQKELNEADQKGCNKKKYSNHWSDKNTYKRVTYLDTKTSQSPSFEYEYKKLYKSVSWFTHPTPLPKSCTADIQNRKEIARVFCQYFDEILEKSTKFICIEVLKYPFEEKYKQWLETNPKIELSR